VRSEAVGAGFGRENSQSAASRRAKGNGTRINADSADFRGSEGTLGSPFDQSTVTTIRSARIRSIRVHQRPIFSAVACNPLKSCRVSGEIAVEDILSVLSGYLHDHWIKFVTAGAFMVAGWFLGKRRARAEWRKKEFLGRLNISLNIVRDGKLLIRTLIEKSCEEIFLNAVAVEAVTDAARRTTAADPILPLPEADYWHYLNAVLNEVSEKFAEGELRRDMGLPVTKEVYLLCLTCESAGEMKTRKIRAMMVRKSALENLPTEAPALESPSHSTRWETLRQLAGAWKATPQRFLAVELCV